MKKFALALLCLSFTTAATAQDKVVHSFTKKHLTPNFWAEGAYAGDFDHDGKTDIVYGPFWFEGPDFVKRHEIYPAAASFKLKKEGGADETIPGFEGALSGKNAYSDNFLTYTYDLNGDGWTDVVVYGFPGKECYWYENPKGKEGHWKKHKLIDVLDNESPMWADINGDGKPEIICGTTEKVEGVPRGFVGYATIDWSDPTKPATFHKISAPGNWGKFTHGIGIGDVNGDGRQDLLLAGGWWEQPASLANDPAWTFHPTSFGSGGAQMYVYDVNGDGLNDVITSIQAHGYGLAWFEQLRETGSDNKPGEPKFRQHLIINKEPKENRYGVKFSQPHAVDLVDMDNDGLKDIVTGKRFWAHGPSGDAEPNAPAVLYWFKLVRNADKTVEFIPYLVDSDSGIGTQVAALDVNGDGLLDIVVGNKKGAFVHLHHTRKVDDAEWQKAQPEVKFPEAGK